MLCLGCLGHVCAIGGDDVCHDGREISSISKDARKIDQTIITRILQDWPVIETWQANLSKPNSADIGLQAVNGWQHAALESSNPLAGVAERDDMFDLGDLHQIN